jgi:hypothetical protein
MSALTPKADIARMSWHVRLYQLSSRRFSDATSALFECPLWVRSGHSAMSVPRPLYRLKADIDWRLDNVRQALKRLNLKLIYVNNSLSKL